VKLGRYEVVRELGKGAMGIVYLAKDPLIGRLVALKTIRPASHADDDETREFQQRFMREAQAAGILNHPNIVTVHDIGQDQESGMSFIAMEYVEGQNFKDVLAQGRALSFEEIGEIVAQVADAIDFAHAKGIVHRDVKPANIILIEGNRAKITDFGIAKIASSGGNLTSTGQFLGTPNYMAPEQIKGSAVDGRTDIFSLGIVFYEALTHRKPFGGDSLTTISYRIVHEAFQPLHEINPRIPDGFEEIAAKSLAKDPARRYQRAREMAIEIRAVARGERPQRIAEPVLADETVITRSADQVPTLEIPFPEAAAMADAAEARRSTADRQARPDVGSFLRRGGKSGGRARKGLDETWGRQLPPPLFFGLVGVTLLLFGLAVAWAMHGRVAAVPVDTRAERLRHQQHQVRTEANRLLRSGNVDNAYQKFQDLSRIAPSSPFVGNMLQQLGAIKLQEVSVKERQIQSKEKLAQGLTLYNNNQVSEAIPLFQEAAQLDPTSNDAAHYLKRAQDEQKQTDSRSRNRSVPGAPIAVNGGAGAVTGGVTTTRAGSPDAARSGGTASLTISFDSPVNDGYIQVKSGGQTLLHVNLWEDRKRAIFHYRAARAINETREVRAHGDLDIWIIVPSMQISWNRRLDLNYLPGSAHKLILALDRTTHQISFQTN
jgi:predicted Ser/Thr protein kinase/tetratricopeptide (TPR) repeat protein